MAECPGDKPSTSWITEATIVRLWSLTPEVLWFRTVNFAIFGHDRAGRLNRQMHVASQLTTQPVHQYLHACKWALASSGKPWLRLMEILNVFAGAHWVHARQYKRIIRTHTWVHGRQYERALLGYEMNIYLSVYQIRNKHMSLDHQIDGAVGRITMRSFNLSCTFTLLKIPHH